MLGNPRTTWDSDPRVCEPMFNIDEGTPRVCTELEHPLCALAHEVFRRTCAKQEASVFASELRLRG